VQKIRGAAGNAGNSDFTTKNTKSTKEKIRKDINYLLFLYFIFVSFVPFVVQNPKLGGRKPGCPQIISQIISSFEQARDLCYNQFLVMINF